MDRAVRAPTSSSTPPPPCHSTRRRTSTPPTWRAPATSSMPLCGTAWSACPRLLDRRLRDPRPPPAARDGQAGGRRALRPGQDPGRDDLPGVPGKRADRADHPPQVVCRPGAPRRLRAPLRLGEHRPQLPHDRRGEQPLPALDVEDLCEAIPLTMTLPESRSTTPSTSAPASSRR